MTLLLPCREKLRVWENKNHVFLKRAPFCRKMFDFWHSSDSITVVCSEVKNVRAATCYIFLLFGLQFLYGSVICHLEEMFFLLSCAVILHFSPVDMRSCKEQAHLYISSDIPGDKCPCFVLWLCKIMCACATFCPGVISRLAYLMKFPLQVSLFIVSELSVMIGAFRTVVCSSTLQRVLCFKSRRSTLTALINVGLNSNLVSSK